jgi:hemerythrin-like domain-containing protein
MKRHKSLHGLSSEHHHGLFWARKLDLTARNWDESQAIETTGAFLKFWESNLANHFIKEEEILFPVYFQCKREITPAVVEALRQHVVIRSAVIGLRDQFDNGTIRQESLRELAILLNKHVRLEERVLFEEIQENCPEEVLQKLAAFPELQKNSG